MKKNLLILAGLTFMFGTAIAQINDNLVACYKFNGNANDLSGHNNNGTVSGATLTSDRFSSSSSAYSFNGTSSYINCGNDTSLSRYNRDFTITAWINLNNASTDFGSVIVSNRENATGVVVGSSFGLTGSLSSIGAGHIVLTTSGGLTFSSAYGATPLTPAFLNTWCHVAVTYKYIGNNLNQVSLYLNGVLDGTGVVNDVPLSTGKTVIGYELTTGLTAPDGYHFDGSIDDIRIYNRMLAPSEIANISMEKKCCTVAGVYLFSGNANDVSSNGNNGTVNGATLTTDRFGYSNSAYSFDGVNDEIELGTNISNAMFNKDFTVTSWVYLTSYSTSFGSDIFSNRGYVNSVTDPEGITLTITGSEAKQGAGHVQFGSSGIPGMFLVTPATISTYQWHNVAVSYKYTGTGVDQATVYIDGLPAVSGPIKSIIPSTSKTYIGFEHPSIASPNAYHFAGKIDDIFVINCALSQEDIHGFYFVNHTYFNCDCGGTATPFGAIPAYRNEVVNAQVNSETDELIFNDKLNVYPNPATSDLSIHGDEIINSVEIYNSLGSRVQKMEQISSQFVNVNIADLVKGVYYVKINFNNQKAPSLKSFVKN